MKDLYVNVKVRNRNMEIIAEEMYELTTYTEMVKLGIQRVITEVNALISKATQRPFEQWDEETLSQFSYIRRLLLDRAGEIGRLPDNLRWEGDDHVRETIPTAKT